MLDAIARFCLISVLLLGIVVCFALMIALIALAIYAIYCIMKVCCYAATICISSLCGNNGDEKDADKEDDEITDNDDSVNEEYT